MVLHLPFDEEVGSAVAYNYAQWRSDSSDGKLSGDCVFNEDQGYLQMVGGNATVSVNADLIDFSGEFTLTAFIKTSENKLLFSIQSAQAKQEVSAEVVPNEWYFLAIQRTYEEDGWHNRVLFDEQILLDELTAEQPVGISVNDENEDGTAIICADDLRVWNRALTLAELFKLQRQDEDVEYYVDGVNFKQFGVEVSKADGLLDALARKDPLRVDWDSEHGEVVDLSRPHWQRREISLECFIVASDNYAFVRAVNKFLAAFEKAGTQRLTCEYAGSVKPLVYDVYRNDTVEIDKTWNDAVMVGTFTLNLIEPKPVKRVLKAILEANSYATITLTTTKMLSVSWGENDASCEYSTDGVTWSVRSKSTNLQGTPLYLRHKYTKAGEYNIVIHGAIEEISGFSTNCIVVWNKL